MKKIFIALCIILLFNFNTIFSKNNLIDKINQNDQFNFIRAKGRNLIIGKDEKIILLKGVCFGNKVWNNPENPPADHHGEIDYKRVKDMNMNVIRFYLNYKLFENDNSPYKYKKSGWDWLDTNISWAKKYGIYLILNIHVPQGGFQSNGEGMALWDNMENQSRLVSLWKAIAARYKDEPVIAGYDLLNEPVSSKSIDQWKNLAQRLVKEIRLVDDNHLIIVERLNGVKGNWSTYSERNFFLINDNNIMYTFHFYSPIEYTHQFTSWTSFKDKDGGKYPDTDLAVFPSDCTWYTAIFNNPKISDGNTKWTYYEGVKYKIEDPKIICGKPAFVSANNNGTVYFGDFVIKEYDEKGNYIRDVINTPIRSLNEWGLWSQNNSGSYSFVNTDGKNAIAISGTTSDANSYGNAYRFQTKTGYYYSISGWIKGKNTTGNNQMRLDFEYTPAGKVIQHRDKKYLKNEMGYYFQWGIENNVPMYLGEFGLYDECFKNDKGGLVWVKDVLDILKNAGINFTYHDYHETGFGIYKGDNGLPDPNYANNYLIILFKNEL